MDANRFDRFSRSLGMRLNRRQALGSLGMAGTAIAGGSQLSMPSVAAAQAGVCSVELTATVRTGPSTGQALSTASSNLGELVGTLVLPVGSANSGTFTTADGSSLPAIVDQTEHTLSIRIDTSLGGSLVLTGMAAEPISSCNGRVDGLFTGPAPGDIGDWHGLFSGDGSQATGGGNGATAGSAGGSTAPSGEPTPGSADACSSLDEPCQAQEDCCPAYVCDVAGGYCRCLELGEQCTQGGSSCCDGAQCAITQGPSFSSCCLPDLSGCSRDGDCCGGHCTGGFCTSPAPPPEEPCGALFGACNSKGVCCGNAYCDMQNPPGTCICAAPGDACIPVGTGACCSGQPCTGVGLCP